MAADYVPIDCSFHDELLAYATLNRTCEIVYRLESGREQTTRGAIADVYAEGPAEYLRVQDGPTIRLDRLLSVSPLP